MYLLIMKTSLIIYKDLLPKNIPKQCILSNYINDLYYCRVKNPPFFQTIYVIHDDLTIEKLKKIYNMCYEGGTIYFLPKYQSFFKSKRNFIKKPNNYIYTLSKKERTMDFIIIGVQRGGTSSLSKNLAAHPEIFIDDDKNQGKAEVHYFDLNLQKGIHWYKKQFNYSYKCVGEKSPDLINLPYTFPIIQSVNAFVKLIVLLRDPIERAFSAWKLEVSRNREMRSFQEAIKDELENPKVKNETFYTIQKLYLQRGLYAKYVSQLLEWFPKQNIFFILFDDIRDNPSPVYKKLYQFLNVKHIQQNYEKEHVSADTSKLNLSIREKLKKYFEKDVKELEKIIQRKINWFS
jgi:hypothetical protein